MLIHFHGGEGEVTVIKAGTQVVQVRTQHTAFRGTPVILCFLLLAPAQGTDPKKCDPRLLRR